MSRQSVALALALAAMVAASHAQESAIPSQVFEAWKNRHERTRTLNAVMRGEKFIPAQSSSYYLFGPGDSGNRPKRVLAPSRDRRDPFTQQFAFKAPQTIYFQREYLGFSSCSGTYEPVLSTNVLVNGQWHSWGRRQGHNGEWVTTRCRRHELQ